MTDRLTTQDVSFLYLEGPSTPMHVGALAIFETPADGFDFRRFVRLIEQRIALVPRYRQKIRTVPGKFANPVWIDDPDFDIDYHLRRSALPRPGSDEQLHELVARLQSRPLDRLRPLWEINFIEGLADGRFAVVTKTHYAMVDGVAAVDLAQVLLDAEPGGDSLPIPPWRPQREPGGIELVVEAISDLVRRPTSFTDTARLAMNEARTTGGRAIGAATGLVSAARAAARAPAMPLNTQIGSQRRFAVARTELADYKRVRGYANGTVNDVVLATVAGALRGWLLARGRPVTPSTTVRTMVPMSVRTLESSVGLGSRVSSHFVDLPVGEPNPLLRLTQISYAMTAHKESGQSVGADALVALSGFAPPTLHALGARAANGITRRLFHLVVTNVPGPQFALYLDQAPMCEIFPIVPLAAGQAVTIGVTSYNGEVYYGLNADWDSMTDITMLASLLEESLAELIAAVEQAPARGRAAPSPAAGTGRNGRGPKAARTTTRRRPN